MRGRTAVVTGGASGIGRAIARRLASLGAHVCVLDIDGEAAQAVVLEIEQAGGKAFARQCDIANAPSVAEACQALFLHAPVDVLVNSAGISHIGNVENTSERDFDRVFSINVKGTYLCMQACVPHMVERGGGVILNIASIAATAGLSDRFAYSMSKGAVLSMTLSVAKDYIGKGIRCNCISPARIRTPFVEGFVARNYPAREQEMFRELSASQPIGRMGKPEEVASLAAYLCSDDASFITGADIPLDGGFFNLRG